MPRNAERALEKAAIQVLRKSRHPMAAREIMEKVVALKLFMPQGETPIKTLYVTIRRANERYIAEGKQPPFIPHKVGKKSIRYTLELPAIEKQT